MAKVVSTLVITEAVLAVLLMAGVLIQTPKSSGLGGTIGGGGDGTGGGYRTRRGLERQIYSRCEPVISGRRHLIAAMAAMVVALVGCQPVATVPKPARGGTAVEALVGAAGVLNPLFESVDSTRDVDSVIYQGLTTVDSQQNVVGLLASDWSVSVDHLTYTFNIRNGIKWADGQPFSADDVLFTFHVLQDIEYTQPGADFWRQVGVGPGGPGQVVFTLKAPSASFPLALRIGIIAKHVFGGMAPAQIAASPYSGVRAFGTGPFKVGALSDLAITLDRNPNAAPQPYLDHLVLRTYPATDPQSAIRAVGQGVADLVGGLEPQEVDSLQAIANNLSVVDSRMFTNSFVSFNPTGDGKQFFGDVNVRLALEQAVDRQRIVTEVLAGKADPDPSPIPVLRSSPRSRAPYETPPTQRGHRRQWPVRIRGHHSRCLGTVE